VSGGVGPQVKGLQTGFKPNLSWTLPANSGCSKEEKTDLMQSNSMLFIPKGTLKNV
jgi:hypothetical protein